MLSPLLSFSSLHQTHFDHVSNQTSVAARHILRPDPLRLSEHSSKHCHGASPLPSIRRRAYDSLSIRSSKASSSSTISSLAFLIRTPIPPTVDQPPKYPILHQSKNKDKGGSTEGSDNDTMAPKSGYYQSSHSSSEGDRVHYNPRREDRERSAASNTKKRTVVVTYGGKTGDPVRKGDIDGKRWK